MHRFFERIFEIWHRKDRQRTLERNVGCDRLQGVKVDSDVTVIESGDNGALTGIDENTAFFIIITVESASQNQIEKLVDTIGGTFIKKIATIINVLTNAHLNRRQEFIREVHCGEKI